MSDDGDRAELERKIEHDARVSAYNRALDLTKIAAGYRARAKDGAEVDPGEVVRLTNAEAAAWSTLGVRQSSAQATALLSDVIQERGGPAIFSGTQMAVARALASHLSGSEIDGKTIADLSALLPPLVSALKGKPWDLELLSDRQLAALQMIAAIATGDEPERPQHKPRSRSWFAAQEAIVILDDVSSRGTVATADETIAIKNAIVAMISPLQVTIRGLWPEHFPPPVSDRLL